MIGEILGKALIKIKGDTKHARDEIAKLSATEQAAAKARVKAQEEANASLERGQQRFALYAAGAAAGWAVVSSSIQKYRKHLEELGPAGAAELKKIDDASKALTGAQDKLQIAIAKVALEAAPAAIELAKMAESIAGIVNGIGQVIEKAKSLGVGNIGVGPVNLGNAAKVAWRYNPMMASTRLAGDAIDYFSGPDQISTPTYMDLTGRESGSAQYGDGAQETRSPEWYRAMGWRLQSTGVWLPPLPKERRRGSGRRESNDPQGFLYGLYGGASGEFGAGLGNLGSEIGAAWDRNAGAGVTGSASGDLYARTKGEQREVSDDLAEYMKELEKLKVDQRKSMLASIFGTPEELSAQADALSLVTSAVDTLAAAGRASMDAWITGSMSAGDAFKKAIGDGLGALAGDMSGKAVRHGIEAIAHLALLDFPGAARHGTAAGLYAAGAITMGGLAKAMHPSAKVGSAKGGGAGTANANAAAGIGGTRGGGEDAPRNLTIVLGDTMGFESPRSRDIAFRQLERSAMQRNPPPPGVSN